MLKGVTSLVFDLDGTISDPSLGICRCFDYAFRFHGFPEVSPERVRAEIGPPLDEAFQKFLPQLDEAAISRLIVTYRKRYAEVGYSENELYPGVADAIVALREGGVLLGVCTSKRKDFAEKILSMFGLLSHFDFVDGGDVGIRKQKQLASLLASNVIDQSAVMIGDREVDIEAARISGLRTVGVLWGFGDLDELSGAGAEVILQSAGELERLVGL